MGDILECPVLHLTARHNEQTVIAVDDPKVPDEEHIVDRYGGIGLPTFFFIGDRKYPELP